MTFRLMHRQLHSISFFFNLRTFVNDWKGRVVTFGYRRRQTILVVQNALFADAIFRSFRQLRSWWKGLRFTGRHQVRRSEKTCGGWRGGLYRR